MKKPIKELLCAGLIFFSGNILAKGVDEAVSEYTKTGHEVISMINSGHVDSKTLEEKVLSLTKNSVIIARAYEKKFPQGKKLLEATIHEVAQLDSSGYVTGLGPLKDKSFSYIEKEWHDFGITSTKDFSIDMGEEDNEHFSDPVHVMVHPLLVLKAHQENNKAAMKEEMDEGLEQVLIVQKSLK